MALNPAQAVIVLTSIVGIAGTASGWYVGSRLPEETEIPVGKILIAGVIILASAGIASAYITRN